MIGGGPIQGGGVGVSEFKKLSDTPNSFVGQSGKTVTVKAAEDGVEYTTPAGGGDMLVATYDPASKSEQLLGNSDIVTIVGNPGSDTKIPSEQGVREALNVVNQKKLKDQYYGVIASGNTTGTLTKPAGAGADVDFIMDGWGVSVDALLSKVDVNDIPIFEPPVNAAGAIITTSFAINGNYTLTDTPSPAAKHAIVFIYTCYFQNFLIAESMQKTEWVGDVLYETNFAATSFLYATSKNVPENKTPAEVRAILDLEIGTDVLAEQTIGIVDNNLMEVDDTDAADNDFAKFTANGLEGRSYSEVLGDLSGQASASFDINSQAITKLSNVVTTHTPAGGATATLDLDVSRIHDITMPVGNITIAVSNENNGDLFTIRILQDGTGNRTVTWFSTIKWAKGSAPTLTTTANKADTFIFRVTGTDTYDGFIVGQDI